MNKADWLQDNLLPCDGRMHKFNGFLDETEARKWYETILKQTSWKQIPISLFGKTYMQPRLIAWYGLTSYTYSGIQFKPLAFPEYFRLLLNRVNAETEQQFNSVLLNLYRNGQDSMGWHSDDEKELGPRPVIASLNLGASRRFLYRHKKDKNLKGEVLADAGSLLLMAGDMQHCWQHAVPKTAKPCDARINLTFRKIISGTLY